VFKEKVGEKRKRKKRIPEKNTGTGNRQKQRWTRGGREAQPRQKANMDMCNDLEKRNNAREGGNYHSTHRGKKKKERGRE